MRSHVIDMADESHSFLPYIGLMNLQIWVNNSTLKLLFWIIKMDLSLMMMGKNTDELVMN